MIIQNGLIFRKEGIFEKADIRISGDVIAQIGENLSASYPDEEILDAAGKYVVPGFVDIHTHGAVGHDFCTGNLEGLEAIAAYERSCGVTSFCPTSMTLPVEQLDRCFRVAGEAMKRQEDERGIPGVSAQQRADGVNEQQGADGVSMHQNEQDIQIISRSRARVLGIHMEGPFLAESRKGAQKWEDLRLPDIEMLKWLNAACGGNIRLVTMAPELPGAMETIRELAGETVFSLGHTDADYDTAKAAFEAGADHVTHLFNAMPGLHHREPNVIGAALDDEKVMVELICDGHHVHPAMVRNVFRMFGADRVILVSDSMEAAGMPDGIYQLGGQAVYKKDGAARLADGTLAGSAANLFECFLNALRFGVPVEDALKAVTINPAKSIGLQHKVGVIEVGAYADLLVGMLPLQG